MISKKKFEEVYRKFSPDTCELFFIKYLSINSLYHKVRTGVIVFSLLTIPFIFALLGHFLNWSKATTYIPSFIYAGILALIGVYVLIIWYRKHKRIKNICKELGISQKRYDELVNNYYYENYFPDIKDYIISILPD